MKTGRFWSSELLLLLGLLGAACLAVWLPAPLALKLAAATLLVAFLPGWLLLRAMDLTLTDWLEQVVLACGLSLAVTLLASLGPLYLVGRLTTGAELGLLGVVALALILVGWLRGAPSDTRPQALPYVEVLFFFIPVAVAAFFSFAHLGYSDYWGDEMNGLLRALSLIHGRPETLLEHTKGPGEVLLPAVFGLLVGRFEPFTLRFPFALAHTLGVGGYYLLVRRLFGRQVGLVAALILALNGLYLAFGRMVQYQALVFLMTGLALLLAYSFYRDGKGVHLALSSFLVGTGLLAHYDMLLVLPPLAYLIWRRWARQPTARKADARWLIGALLILLAVVMPFYVPFLANPHLAATSSYLARIVGGSGWPASNFDELYAFAVLYNSVYYGAFIALLALGTLLADLVGLLRDRRRDKWFGAMAAITLALALLGVVTAQTPFPSGTQAGVLLLICAWVVVLLVGFSSLATEVQLVYVWAGVSFVAYVFLVDHPRTHLQIIYPGASILVALGIRRLVAAVRRRLGMRRSGWTTAAALAVSVSLFALFAGYEYLLFVDTNREYVFTYPDHKSHVYWEPADFPFNSRRPYGMPHRLGWQMINQLYLQGDLQGDWDSNDDGTNLFWYTLGSPRNTCYPRYYFRAEFQQKETEEEPLPAFSLANYVEIGQVWNGDHLQIRVYEFAPAGRDAEEAIWREPAQYATSLAPGGLHSLPYQETAPKMSVPLAQPALFSPSPGALQHIAGQYGDARIVNVRDKVALLGYDLDDRWLDAGGPLVLTLYWQAVDVVNLPYKVFVHVEAGTGAEATPTLLAQSDDYPACGTRPVPDWGVGQIVADRHVIELPQDRPAGDYVVRVGIYEPQTGLRMDTLDSLGNPQGTSFDLTHVTIQPSTEVTRGAIASFSGHSTP
jgi:4-amino-4-deoxy-L-arabinose transferase-like glycosyltransferase